MRLLVLLALAFSVVLQRAAACSSISHNSNSKIRAKKKKDQSNAASGAGAGTSSKGTSSKGTALLLDWLLDERNMNVRHPKLTRAGKSDVVVLFDLVVNKVVEFDSMAGVLRLNVFFQLFWNDERLLFDGMQEMGPVWTSGEDAITVAEESVWTPQVVPFNSHEDKFCETTVSIYDKHFYKQHGYNVIWSRPAVVNVHCDSRLESFPFDVQECTLVVGPWSSTVGWYSFRSRRKEVGNASSFQSEEWEVLSTSFKNAKELYRTGFTEEVRFSMTFRRYPYYIVVSALMPMGLSVILNGLSMWLPIEGSSGERMSYTVMMLLTILAVALFTAQLRPAVREETWLERAQSWCFMLAFFPVFESLLVVWLQHLFEKVENSGERRAGHSVTSESGEGRAGSVTSGERRAGHSSSGESGERRSSVISDGSLMRHRRWHFNFLQHRAVALGALRAQEATFRSKFVVYLMEQVPTLEWCLTGRTSRPFSPRTLDRWCRFWLSVVLLVLCTVFVLQLPPTGFTRTSVLVLLGAMGVVATFYLCAAGCSLLFLILEIVVFCTEPRATSESVAAAQPEAKEEGPPECPPESAESGGVMMEN